MNIVHNPHQRSNYCHDDNRHHYHSYIVLSKASRRWKLSTGGKTRSFVLITELKYYAITFIIVKVMMTMIITAIITKATLIAIDTISQI